MFVLRRPADVRLCAYLEACRARELNYPGLSIESLRTPPSGFAVDRYGGVLGRGEACYEAAVEALRAWAMYPPGWTSVFALDEPLVVGSVYVSVIRHLGLYALLPGRVIEIFDEHDEGSGRCGFAFATLVGHPERGVERFAVSWTADDDEVRYDALAVSRPGPLMWWVASIARRAQLRFHAQSAEGMRAFIEARQSSF